MMQTPPDPSDLRPRRRGDGVPLLAALAAGAIGVVNVVSALTPSMRDRVQDVNDVVPSEIPMAAHALALPAGLALLVMAFYLARRRRRALRAGVALLIALGVLNLVKGLDWEEAVASFALAGALVWARHAFCATDSDGRARGALLRVLATWTAAGLAASVAIAAGRPWVALGALAVSAVGVTIWALYMPIAEPAHLPSSGARQLARDIVKSHGVDTLSFFKLREDLHRHFTADARAFCSYRVENGVLLVAGDPVGPADALPEIVREVCALADLRGLRIGVVGASESMMALWERAGLRSFYIGDEAIIDTGAFSLEGRKIRKVRQSVSRMEKAGYTAELRLFGELTPAEVGELEGVSERWRDGAPERGFSMALDSLRGEHLADSAVLLARDGSGVVKAFLHFVPVFGRPAASLSFMRRELDTPNGITEFLVVEAIAALRERGVEEISLNFAAFARLMHSPETAWERFLGRLAKVFNPYFQIESLYRFNAKFFPRWQPRYLLYEGRLGIVQTGLAAIAAEGQLPGIQRSGRSG